MAEVKRVPETRLLLIGRTGCGKSSTGNSILGEKAFATSLSFASSTQHTTYEERTRHGRRLVVIDTPGFYDTVKTNGEIIREISKVFGYLSSGFHAMLYVLNTDRFTQESIKTKKLFFRTFGEDVTKYTILVLTHYDRVKEEGITDIVEYLKLSGPEFTTFYKACGKRLVTFNNKATGTEMDRQVMELLNMVDKVNRDNYGNVYTNFHLRLVHTFTKIERKRRRDLRRTREVLFNRAVIHLGMERMVTWDNEQDRPMRLKALEDQSVLQQYVPVPSRTRLKPTNKIKAVPVKPQHQIDIAVSQSKNGTSEIRRAQTEGSENALNESVMENAEISKAEKSSAKRKDKSSELSSQIKKEESKDIGSKKVAPVPDPVDEELVLQDIEKDVDVSNLHDECEDEALEHRKAMKDQNLINRLVDFFCVFFERLI